MYQVIYSSIVIWCAILTWLLMGRPLTRTQWIAIIGTSVGLCVSSLDSIQGSIFVADDFAVEDSKGIYLSMLDAAQKLSTYSLLIA